MALLDMMMAAIFTREVMVKRQ
jgi:hypothetical protein